MTKTRAQSVVTGSVTESEMPLSTNSIPPDIDISKLSSESKELFLCISKYFHRLLDLKDEKIAQLENEIQHLKDKINNVEDQMDDAAAYSRRDSLIVSGLIPEGSRDEDCKATVTDLLRQQVNINIDPRDISIAHRIGNKRQQGPDRRNIIFKLCRRDLKYDIINACRQQRPRFYINESLTPTRSKICFILRQIKKRYHQIKTIRTHEGSVAVYLLPTGRDSSERLPMSQLRKLTVNTHGQLVKLLEEELKTSLSDFNLDWRTE